MLLRAAASLSRAALGLGPVCQSPLPAAAAAVGALGSARALSAAALPAPLPVAPEREEELSEFRESVRQFASAFVAPHAAEIDRLNGYPAGFEFWQRAGEWGLHGEHGAGSHCVRRAVLLHAPLDTQPPLLLSKNRSCTASS